MTKIIALTGATGFVGRHLLHTLASNGFIIKALTRKPQSELKNVIWVSGDIQNQSSLKEIVEEADVIINVAGLIKAKNRDEFISANATAVKNLLDAISPDKNPHFIQVSSLTAREENISDYAFSKKQGESILNSYPNQLKWTIVRPPGIYGPRDNETIKIFKMIKSRIALYPDNKDNRVSWINVSDLVSAILHLMNNEKYIHKILEVDDGNKNGYSHEEFYNAASKTLNVEPVFLTIPKFILKIVGHTNDILGRIFNYAPMVSAKKVNEICHSDWVCKKNSEFCMDDWSAKIDLKTGLKETLDWYKNNKYI